MRIWGVALLCGAMGMAGAAEEAQARTQRPESRAQHWTQHHGARPPAKAAPSGAVQHGHASVYASRFAGRRMADGNRFDPRAATVASRTLPLGSTARVTNLRNGRSVTVRVTDRGPHLRHRIVDLSPAVASSLGMGRAGLAMVSVAPVSPLPVSFVPAARAAEAKPARRR